MSGSAEQTAFDTDKRIRLGVWGLGRGAYVFRSPETNALLHLDIVAGCDTNPKMRADFQEQHPDAFVTDDAEAFLNTDMDAVFLATYSTDHAADAIRCLDAGFHVLSECASYHTMAEGVALYEAVQRSGKVYNLAENYPWIKPNMHLANLWRRGIFGEFQYAEYEYLHNCRTLAYTTIFGDPVEPGWNVHAWRTWMNWHFYNSHSMGPVMYITDLRPKRVVTLPHQVKLPGYPPREPMHSTGTVAPSLITFENGGLMRNLMGSTTMDAHDRRIWGTLGAAKLEGNTIRLSLGRSKPSILVNPKWPMLAEFAEKAGHSGGDFWCPYQFVNEVLNGEPAYFGIDRASDCAAAGILAYRSAMENGTPYDIPDFSRPEDRDAWRNDHYAPPRFPVDGCFPEEQRPKAARFSTLALELVKGAEVCRSALSWLECRDALADPASVQPVFDAFLKQRDHIAAVAKEARELASATPGSRGAEVIDELYNMGALDTTLSDAFLAEVEAAREG